MKVGNTLYTTNEKSEIGNSVNAMNLFYYSLKKYCIGNEENNQNLNLYLEKIKFFYERDECLIAIQFIMKNKDTGEASFTDSKILGPVDTYITSKNIDEITLTLDKDEEIYLIKGGFNVCDNRIVKLSVYSTFGQFMEFGVNAHGNNLLNFSWEYYYNLKHFDGFIVGWDDKKINYLAMLINEKPQNQSDNVQVNLNDTTYESYAVNFDPIYLSATYGKIDAYTTVNNDLENLNIFKKPFYISEITVYYDKFINYIEVEYTHAMTGEKLKSVHSGTESKLLFINFS